MSKPHLRLELKSKVPNNFRQVSSDEKLRNMLKYRKFNVKPCILEMVWYEECMCRVPRDSVQIGYKVITMHHGVTDITRISWREISNGYDHNGHLQTARVWEAFDDYPRRAS